MTRRVSDIKVKLADREAIALVRPEALTALLERHGYEEKQERKSKEHGLIGWQFKLAASEPRWVFVPARLDFADYTLRVAEAIEDIAEVSDRSQLAILLELLGVTDDLPLLPEPSEPQPV